MAPFPIESSKESGTYFIEHSVNEILTITRSP